MDSKSEEESPEKKYSEPEISVGDAEPDSQIQPLKTKEHDVKPESSVEQEKQDVEQESSVQQAQQEFKEIQNLKPESSIKENCKGL